MIFKAMYQSHSNIIHSFIVLGCVLTTYNKDLMMMIMMMMTMSSGTAVYPHMPILGPHAARFHERRISSAAFGQRAH